MLADLVDAFCHRNEKRMHAMISKERDWSTNRSAGSKEGSIVMLSCREVDREVRTQHRAEIVIRIG